VNLSDRDLERLLREACAPVAPPDALRGRVLRAASASRAAGRALVRFLLPYAAGVASVLLADRALRTEPEPSREPPAVPAQSVRLDSIADRAPVAPPAPERVAAPRPDADVAAAPVPRIS
jgi:hypothetical protein